MLNPKYMRVYFDSDDSGSGAAESDQDTYELKLKTRHEHILAKIAGDSSARDIKPKTREEYLLLSFLQGDDNIAEPTPISNDLPSDNGGK